MKKTLYGIARDEVAASLQDIGIAPPQVQMRTRQVWNAMYVLGAQDFHAVTSISKQHRALLDEHFSLQRPQVVTEQKSADGTVKWLLRLKDNATARNQDGASSTCQSTEPEAAARQRQRPPVEIETVFIPDAHRATLCLSSQVGCTLNCSFCHTGTQRLVRNLTASEIIAQILVARDRLGWDRGTPSTADKPQITNIVMMGMGEPLYNFAAVKSALAIAIDPSGLGFSRRRVTVSTSGVVPMMQRLGEELDVMLAVSLHAVRDDIRDVLVPLNRRHPIAQLLQACREYKGLSNARRITFEYVMLHEVNDSTADARELVRLIQGIPAKINLIPFNPWPGCGYTRSSDERIANFAAIVKRAGYASPVRTPRGVDIMAACGQLKSLSEVRLPRRAVS